MDAPPLAPATRRERAAGAFLIAALCGAAAFLPADRPFPFDICLWRRLTGTPCPGCGLTRSIGLLLRGKWSASLAMHPAGSLFLALFLLVAAGMGLEAAFGRPVAREARRAIGARLLAAGTAIAVLNWILGALRR